MNKIPLELVDLIYDKLHIEFIVENYRGDWVDYSSPAHCLFYEKLIKMEKYWEKQGIYNLIFKGDFIGIKYIIENFTKYGVKENLNHYILEGSRSVRNSLEMVQYFVSIADSLKVDIVESLYIAAIMAIINDNIQLLKFIIDRDRKNTGYYHFGMCNAYFLCELAINGKNRKYTNKMIYILTEQSLPHDIFSPIRDHNVFIRNIFNNFACNVELSNSFDMQFYCYFLQDDPRYDSS
jgi:hypothetical protein